jgi:hypothetical protein
MQQQQRESHHILHGIKIKVEHAHAKDTNFDKNKVEHGLTFARCGRNAAPTSPFLIHKLAAQVDTRNDLEWWRCPGVGNLPN